MLTMTRRAGQEPALAIGLPATPSSLALRVQERELDAGRVVLDRPLTTREGWHWWETAALGCAAALVLAVILALDPSPFSSDALARTAAVVGSVLATASGLLLYVDWRLVGGGPLGWLVLGVTSTSVHLFTMAGLALADPQRIEQAPDMVVASRTAVTVAVLVVVWVAARGWGLDPRRAGVGLAATFVAGHVSIVLVPRLAPTPHLRGLVLLVLLVLALDLAVVVATAVFPAIPRWIRLRMAIALGGFAFAHVATYATPVLGWWGAVLATAGQLVAATVMLAVSIHLVRGAVRGHRATVRALGRQIVQVQAEHRAEQALRHEIRATIAGIACAAELIHDPEALAPAKRAAITGMMSSELHRLGRLAEPVPERRCEAVDVVATLQPLVTRLVAQGHRVRTSLAGATVLGRADEVAATVNVLLENAVRHGGGVDLAVDCRQVGASVEITVRDGGPGVPPELRDRIFAWGLSGPESRGEGIGLHVARAVCVEHGGDLRLDPTTERGATFVVTLPAYAGRR